MDSPSQQAPEIPHGDQPQDPPELFDDPELTARWWGSLSFLNLETRLLVVRGAIPRCTSEECLAMLRAVEADLAQLLGPKPLLEVFLTHLRPVVRQHPLFTGAVGVSVVYMLIRAGGGLMELAQRYGQ